MRAGDIAAAAGLRRAVTGRTKVIILDSPGNPTGAVFSPDALGEVARLAVERNLWVVSDECYEALTYEGRHVSIATLSPQIKARTLVVNTCSKAYAMTGWRIGYAAGPRAIIKAMTDVQSQVTSNPTSIAQWAAVEALAGPQDEIATMVGEFDRRRRVIVEGLNAMPGVSCVLPKGAFYAFPNVSGLFGKRCKAGALQGSADVCAFLLDEARIATGFLEDVIAELARSPDMEVLAARTSLSLSSAVSRLTSQDRRSRPAASDCCSAASTAPTSSCSMRQDSRVLSTQPISTTTSNAASAVSGPGAATRRATCAKASACSPQASAPTTPTPSHQARAPDTKAGAGDQEEMTRPHTSR